LAWAVAGAIWVLWLGFEDRGPATPVGMAAILAAAWGATAFLKEGDARAGRQPGRALLIGLAAGSAVGPGAALLMLIKTSIHSHPVLDFTPADLSAAIGRTPIWAGVGLLAGAGVALLVAAREGGNGPSPTARDAQATVRPSDFGERGPSGFAPPMAGPRDLGERGLSGTRSARPPRSAAEGPGRSSTSPHNNTGGARGAVESPSPREDEDE
jgi:hypothetical protein